MIRSSNIPHGNSSKALKTAEENRIAETTGNLQLFQTCAPLKPRDRARRPVPCADSDGPHLVQFADLREHLGLDPRGDYPERPQFLKPPEAIKLALAKVFWILDARSIVERHFYFAKAWQFLKPANNGPGHNSRALGKGKIDDLEMLKSF